MQTPIAIFQALLHTLPNLSTAPRTHVTHPSLCPNPFAPLLEQPGLSQTLRLAPQSPSPQESPGSHLCQSENS